MADQKITNQEKVLLEDELWKLEVVEDNPEFLSKTEYKRTVARIKEIKKLLEENE